MNQKTNSLKTGPRHAAGVGVLLLVGCGEMGGALLSRWRKTKPGGIADFWVVEPSRAPMSGMKSRWVADLKFLPAGVKPSVVVFAVKPQQLAGILPAYHARFKDKPLYLSIAAGKTLAFYASHLSARARIIRAMPNTPALVGQAMSVLVSPKKLAAPTRDLATALMESVGKVEWVNDEKLLDAVTALSGSGPAYMFLFLDALTKAAVAAGLNEPCARALATQTMIGSGYLAAASDESLEQLRKNVTSSGGTTEAALKPLLENDALEKLVKAAIDKAVERSKLL